jgi:hypothetical protein
MAKWNKSLLEEIKGYNSIGLTVAFQHFSELQEVARKNGQGDVVEEIGTHLELIKREATNRNFALTSPN